MSFLSHPTIASLTAFDRRLGAGEIYLLLVRGPIGGLVR